MVQDDGSIEGPGAACQRFETETVPGSAFLLFWRFLRRAPGGQNQCLTRYEKKNENDFHSASTRDGYGRLLCFASCGKGTFHARQTSLFA